MKCICDERHPLASRAKHYKCSRTLRNCWPIRNMVESDIRKSNFESGSIYVIICAERRHNNDFVYLHAELNVYMNIDIEYNNIVYHSRWRWCSVYYSHRIQTLTAAAFSVINFMLMMKWPSSSMHKVFIKTETTTLVYILYDWRRHVDAHRRIFGRFECSCGVWSFAMDLYADAEGIKSITFNSVPFKTRSMLAVCCPHVPKWGCRLDADYRNSSHALYHRY